MKRYVARQPILDRRLAVFGYELLFREGLENYFRCEDPDRASSSVVVDSFFLFGLEHLTAGRKAFLNFTDNLIIGGYARLLPHDHFVIELLETINPTDAIVGACRKLKDQGYTIALDDFVDTHAIEPLTGLADILKIDFQTTSPDTRRTIAQKFGPRGIKLLAEKVEDRHQFKEALDLGFSYFQGYFFYKPEVMTRREVPVFRSNYLWILKEINQAEPKLDEIEKVIRQDSSLCYKLLKYLNSALFPFVSQISSIRHALSLIGVHEIKKWVSLLALSNMGEQKPEELISCSVIRARFCETIGTRIGTENRASELFLVGLFSVIDAIVERPMNEVLSEIHLSNDVASALLGESNDLSKILDLAIAYERGIWSATLEHAGLLGLDEAAVTEAYLEAVQWREEVLKIQQVA